MQALRRQLRELAESLGARDLEKVVTFAEFVKARRAARNYGGRPDAPTTPVPESDGGSDGSDDEEPTPSSRRRTAALR